MKLYLSIILFLILGFACSADNSQLDINLPAMETFVTEPTIIENVRIWVPAARNGPFINNSCKAKENLSSSSVLPASINHQKTDICPNPIARILAELIAFYHTQSLPLTIFNGWQWKYSYSMCQYESTHYKLKEDGGCWENAWEAILSLSCGTSRMQLLKLKSLEKFSTLKSTLSQSTIEIQTFSSMRTRNGYPKERQL